MVRQVRGWLPTISGCSVPVFWAMLWCLLPGLDSESASSSIRFSKACLKNVFSVLLIFIYLLLMAVAVFLVYQTITDFREKLKHPVMSVSYKEVDRYDAPGRAYLSQVPELQLWGQLAPPPPATTYPQPWWRCAGVDSAAVLLPDLQKECCREAWATRGSWRTGRWGELCRGGLAAGLWGVHSGQ